MATTSTLFSEPRDLSTFPTTPPYTPNVARRRVRPSASPASIRSLHPAETASPSQKSQQDSQPDEVHIQELKEGDTGFNTDNDLVYPLELEEPDSDLETSDISSNSDSESGNEITAHFSRLDCDDTEQENSFERRRRLNHVRRRTNSRVFKRTHSQSVKGEVEMSDSDAMGDQDRDSSARRLRRRVKGPNGVQVVYDEVQRTPPPSREGGIGRDELWLHHSRGSESSAPLRSVDEGMDIDDSE